MGSRGSWRAGADRSYQVPVEIVPTKSGVDPLTIRMSTFTTQSFDDQPLYPEILRTCRQAHLEATPLLYAENAFSFTNFSSSSSEPEDPLTRLPLEARRACKNLMFHPIFDWDVSVPPLIRTSSLAAFLRKIGPSNSAQIRSLRLSGENTHQAADDIILASALCATHTPRLRKLAVHVEEKRIAWDESPDHWHPDYSSPYWANGALEPMYGALRNFVARVHWLEVLAWDRHGLWRFAEADAWGRLLELEEAVRERTEKRKLKKGGRRGPLKGVLDFEMMGGDEGS
ncbi:MAG: hypothetical protein LQ346_007965 [Caloplaca aetnensis]|nr:MAG: hypothetical protein LQ346_007965 [Caloplaca aetnensis]